MKLNKKNINTVKTHEGATTYKISDLQQLRRSVMSCLLWEKQFYEDGEDIADRIYKYSQLVPAATLADLAYETRTQGNLRHVPLVMLSALTKTGAGSSLPGDTIAKVIQRADELTEFLAVHAKVNGVGPDKLKKILSAQAKKGLAQAFQKFNAYQLAKYNRGEAIKLRDVLFLCHAKPKDDDQASVWQKLIDGTLESPDTWEVNLSAGEDKCATFTRLLQQNKLGYIALLRNLRNMEEAGVDRKLVKDAILARKGAERTLPFRYVAAARAAPSFEPELDQALKVAISQLPKLKGETVVLVDHSGSMMDRLSSRSDLTRFDAAAALASVVTGDDIRVFSFTNDTVEVPYRTGMAGIAAISNAQHWGGTYLGAAIRHVTAAVPNMDRLIVITDEQSHDTVVAPKGAKNYMINVASYKNGVSYNKDWTHVDGFSENVLKFIYELEASDE